MISISIAKLKEFVEVNFAHSATAGIILNLFRLIRKIFVEITFPLFREGGKYYCACCGKRFDRYDTYVPFKKFGANKGCKIVHESICPYCHSKPRQRAECILFDKFVKIDRTDEVLIFAPTESMDTYFRRNGLAYVSADFLRNHYDLQIDIQNMKLHSESRDLIICNMILEHVQNDRQALAELARVIRPDGKVIITVPINVNLAYTAEEISPVDAEEREWLYGQYDHLRLYGLEDFKNRLKVWFDFTIFDASKADPRNYPLFGPGFIDCNYVFVCTKKGNKLLRGGSRNKGLK